METLEQYGLKAQLLERLDWCAKAYAADLQFVPADKFDASPMGKARSPLEFTKEVVSFNFGIAQRLAGEEPLSAEARKAISDSMTTPETAAQAFNQSISNLREALTKSTEERLADKVKVPWDDAMRLGALVMMGINHVMYHDGQLAYIQSLYGDDDMHWDL